jgi:hypothetical protein
LKGAATNTELLGKGAASNPRSPKVPDLTRGLAEAVGATRDTRGNISGTGKRGEGSKASLEPAPLDLKGIEAGEPEKPELTFSLTRAEGATRVTGGSNSKAGKAGKTKWEDGLTE